LSAELVMKNSSDDPTRGTGMSLSPKKNYKWYVLILGALTNTVVLAMPGMALAVLLPEISADLKLNLVQAGTVWGVTSISLIVASLFAGSLCDRYGPKRVMLADILLVALLGSLRGLASSYGTLLVTVLLASLFGPVVSVSNLKNARIWFADRELGAASGILALGMAAGFFLGSLVSASVLSPWLGGWRHVFFFLSGLMLLFLVPWALMANPPASLVHTSTEPHPSLAQSFRHVAKLKDIWLLGLGALGVSGGIQGVLGYLPLYLRGLGWSGLNADGAVAAFNIASMACVVPISLLSDRLNSRKKLTVGAALVIATGIGLLSFVRGAGIWTSAVVAGLLRDGFMALFLAMVIQSRGIGHTYSGTATGFAMVLFGVGNLVSPPLGNSLASLGTGAPFVFWTVLILLGGLLISFSKEEIPVILKKENTDANENGQHPERDHPAAFEPGQD
jgi:predicted MFS family arabinose efflux permease